MRKRRCLSSSFSQTRSLFSQKTRFLHKGRARYSDLAQSIVWHLCTSMQSAVRPVRTCLSNSRGTDEEITTRWRDESSLPKNIRSCRGGGTIWKSQLPVMGGEIGSGCSSLVQINISQFFTVNELCVQSVLLYCLSCRHSHSLHPPPPTHLQLNKTRRSGFNLSYTNSGALRFSRIHSDNRESVLVASRPCLNASSLLQAGEEKR